MNCRHSFVKLLFLLSSMCCIGTTIFAQSQIETLQDVKIHIAKQANPNESLVQWYYTIEDLRQAVITQAPQSPVVQKLTLLSSGLRQEIDQKKLLRPLSSRVSLLTDQYRSGVLTKDKTLDKPCPQFSTLVDDWSFALDLPSSLVMATWLMENGCGRSRPANGDGIFQIVSKDYGTGAMTTGHWIWMMYDFNDFVRTKFARYNKANGLTGGLPINYQYIDYTGIVLFGSLYNGLSGGTVRGDIMPASANYVFGKFNDQYSGAVKDGLLVRVMKAMKVIEGSKK